MYIGHCVQFTDKIFIWHYCALADTARGQPQPGQGLFTILLSFHLGGGELNLPWGRNILRWSKQMPIIIVPCLVESFEFAFLKKMNQISNPCPSLYPRPTCGWENAQIAQPPPRLQHSIKFSASLLKTPPGLKGFSFTSSPPSSSASSPLNSHKNENVPALSKYLDAALW